MAADTDNERVDELRRQLRSLGYLDAGVDRFLLAPVSGGRGPVSLAALASGRVGLLGGMLLGPAAAIGIGARLPGLLSGVRDAGVIALYLAIFFFLALTATSLVVTSLSTIVARVRRPGFAGRAARVSRAAGWVTSLACLAYLTLWWRNANAGFGWSAPVWTAFALLVAVTISLLIGHAQRVTALAVLASAAGPEAALPPSGGRSWQVVLAGGTLAFIGAAALLVATTTDAAVAAKAPQPLTVGGTGLSIRLIAIDGFDPAVYDSLHLIGGGPLLDLFPTRLRLEPQDTLDPARAWTTIATGQPPDVHGVHQLETRRVAGIKGTLISSDAPLPRAIRAATDIVRLTRPSVASRDERRSKTIWEVAEDAGLRTAVINWWATWPAPAGPGIVITDRALLRLERGGALDSEIAPAELYPQLQRAWPSLRGSARDTAASEFPGDSPIAAVLRRSAELDATLVAIWRTLPEPARDLDVIYLPGLDIAQHTLLSASESTSSPSVITERVNAIKGYYAFLIRLLQPLVAAGPRQVVMVVASPGRIETPSSGLVGVKVGGVFIDGKSTASTRPIDIAPTVLQLLGIPLSRELPGHPYPAPMLPRSRAEEIRYVPSYGRPYSGTAPRAGKPLDQETIDRLRSLGYIK